MSVLQKHADDIDGILLLIDEADKPSAEAGLGLVCKMVTEELSRSRCERLCIGVAGLPGVLHRLGESHESSPRIFKIMQLQPLERHECVSVIRSGLKEVLEKTAIAVEVTEEAALEIASLSEGYPHFLQEFAYAAYEEDSDNLIDKDDVVQSLTRENGPFEQLGRKFFSQFYTAPSSDDYRTVLHTMADNLDGWTDRAAIIAASKLKEATVDNALRALKAKNIIVQDESRRGRYRLPTRAFAVWIKGKQAAQEVG